MDVHEEQPSWGKSKPISRRGHEFLLLMKDRGPLLIVNTMKVRGVTIIILVPIQYIRLFILDFDVVRRLL